MRTVTVVPVLAVLVLAAGCGEQTGARVAAPDPTPRATPEVVATTTVLDAGSGPQLCLGGVQQSHPPQCGGPAVTGWDWDEVEHDAVGGVRWGSYDVRGTWDGERLTLTAPPSAPSAPEDFDSAAFFASPCPEPEGGWRPVDPSTTSEAALQRALRRANRLERVGEVWLDQTPNPAFGRDDVEAHERINDPTLLVLNVHVFGDAAERADAERQLREVWGGALCVSETQRTRRELRRIQNEVQKLVSTDDLLMASAGRDRVEITVVYDDGSLQAELDETYGAGVVQVSSALRPAPE